MAELDKDKIIETILQVVKDNNIMFISHIFGYDVGCSRRYFYDNEMHKCTPIGEALEKNKSNTKNFLLNDFISSKNAAERLVLLRFLSDKDERDIIADRVKDDTNNKKIEIKLVR